MSTRCTTHFTDAAGNSEAIIYRHCDGYPEGAGKDLLRFLDEVGKLRDTRFNGPSYLAAKYVVFLADMFNNNKASKLDFLSVGIVREDPSDIEYRYVVRCVGGRPIVKCLEADGFSESQTWKEVDLITA